MKKPEILCGASLPILSILTFRGSSLSLGITTYTGVEPDVRWSHLPNVRTGSIAKRLRLPPTYGGTGETSGPTQSLTAVCICLVSNTSGSFKQPSMRV